MKRNWKRCTPASGTITNSTFASAQPLGDENFQINGAPTRVSKLKADIRALGDVNVGAIEQYETVSERVESLSEEREDLTCAKANLEEVIAKFEVEIKERFKTQFELINENFKIVFSQLFNGGTAELRLSDPDDLMETGIEIAAQPPGKKLQALSLLSGGERTLTAIALLFAMLNIKPTPFCVLDEIEAALDEANTGMYAEFLKEDSRKRRSSSSSPIKKKAWKCPTPCTASRCRNAAFQVLSPSS